MTETMQALVFHGAGRSSVDTVPVPRVVHDQDVLLQVECASICGTDLHVLADPPGHPATPGSILGHEYVATVVEAGGAVSHLRAGDRVVIDPNVTCGLCAYCRLGLSNACENMTTLGIFRDGGLAEFNVAPAKALHPISRDVPSEYATLAEPLTCVLHAFEKASFVPGESAVVLGAGPIGLLFLLLFRAAGAGQLIAVEPVRFRREHALACGADVVVDPSEQDLTVVKEITRIGADVVVDAAGSLFTQAVSLVRRGGRVILFGMNQHAEPRVSQYDITRGEISIHGSFIQRTAFPKVIRMLESGSLPLQNVVTHQLPLREVGLGLDLLRKGEALKAVIRPNP